MLLILEVSLYCFGTSLSILFCLFVFVEIHSDAEFWMPKEYGILGVNDMIPAAAVATVRRHQGLPCDGCSHLHFTGHSWAQQQLLMITYFVIIILLLSTKSKIDLMVKYMPRVIRSKGWEEEMRQSEPLEAQGSGWCIQNSGRIGWAECTVVTPEVSWYRKMGGTWEKE